MCKELADLPIKVRGANSRHVTFVHRTRGIKCNQPYIIGYTMCLMLDHQCNKVTTAVMDLVHTAFEVLSPMHAFKHDEFA